MKLALVAAQPGPEWGTTLQYVKAAIAGCAAAVPLGADEVDVKTFYAVDTMQPGHKAPGIRLIREQRPRLLHDLKVWKPDAVVSLGATALAALAPAGKKPTLRREHGRMRWLDLDPDRPDRKLAPWTPTIEPFRVVKSPDLHRDFVAVIYKAMVQREPLAPMDIELHVPMNVPDLRSALGLLVGATVVGVDVETTGLSPYRDGMLAVGIGAVYDETSGIAVVVPRDLLDPPNPDVDEILWGQVWRQTRRSVGHNLKFDQQFLAPVVGWAPPDALLGDTLLLHHLLDERPNRPGSRARGSGLKDLVAQRYDYQYGFDFEGGVAVEDLPAMYAYLGDDVVYTARLWHDEVDEAQAESPMILTAHDELLMPASVALAKAEYAGAPVDVAWVQDSVDALDVSIARRKAWVERTLPSLAATEVTNIMSPQQIADVMYDEWRWTPDARVHGKIQEDDRSTDVDHMKAAIAKYKVHPKRIERRRAWWCASLVKLRKDTKQRASLQKTLIDRVDDDGRIRASFLLHGASTGRLSSREPNLQNIAAVIDKRDGPKPYMLADKTWTDRPPRMAFRARPGYVWAEVDYSQLELRVAAALSGDGAFRQIFVTGADVHKEVAAAIFSKAPEDVQKGERYIAKAVSFGVIYGRTAAALAGGEEMDFAVRELGLARWTEAQAQIFIDKLLGSYPDLRAWMVTQTEQALRDQYVETYFGRRRRFPFFTKRDHKAIGRQAVNTPIQSAASDLCLTSLVELSERLDTAGLDATILFPVHDSICIEVLETDAKALEHLCRSVMERDFLGVPLKVDYEYGPTWAETEVHA